MTSEWYRIPWDVLEKSSTHIVNEVKYVNCGVYDITSKLRVSRLNTVEWGDIKESEIFI